MLTIRKVLQVFIYIASVFIVTVFLYNYVFFVIQVPSASMYPTIEVGDRIITTRILSASSIDRGDILVFQSDEFKEVMVKRVIGFPNDRIEIKANGKVFVNDRELNETYVKYPDDKSGSFIVPEGEYFFLGDYRVHSYDSRKWKDPFIPEKRILGEARFVLFPFQRISLL